MMDYYFGLDIGTDSVGWAVTNPQYEIGKFKGNAMWGIELFDQAQTAADYRSFRSARRRRQRAKERVAYLEMIFNEEIAKKDVAFFQRLKESAFWQEDKSEQTKYSLFADPDFTDADYYKRYPTVYHLQKELITSDQAKDIRMVYLAILKLFKSRGHFLFDSVGEVDSTDFSDIWEDFNAFLKETFFEDSELCFDEAAGEDVGNILKSKEFGVTKKKEQLIARLCVNKKEKQLVEILAALCGASVDLSKLFADETLKEGEVKKFSFKSGFEDVQPQLEQVLGERFELVERLKAMYDWALLADILNGEKYLCFSRVAVFEQHHRDLALLKTFVKEYCPEKYNLIFNLNNGKENYVRYSGHVKKGERPKALLQEDFCKFLKTTLPSVEDPKYDEMFARIQAGSFMPKIITKDNGVIPMQLHLKELQKILENAEKYLPFLKKKDESGKTNTEKIIAVFNYRIPYYIGPLNTHSSRHWLARKGEKIYPWNFEQVVDVQASAENFIQNLTSKCSYLPDQDVLPKNSLLYTKFMVLNELNNLKLNGEKPDIATKQGIYENLFLQGGKVTQAKLKKYLKSLGYPADVEISGIDGDFKASLKSHKDLAPFALSELEKEQVIRDITIFADDKKLLRKRLKSYLGEKLSSDEILAISKLKYGDWGRLSHAFLCELYGGVNPNTGEVINIITALWETNDNLMQLLFSEAFTFGEALREYTGKFAVKSLKEEVEGLYISPMVKRPVYQAMKILAEIAKIQKCPPKKIFVEVAKGAEKKERTISRKQQLIDLYKQCKLQSSELFRSLNEREESELKRDALYLYYTQFGKCMYSGEPIDLDSLLAHASIYDIDHIYPQSKIKDDSLNNRVLVLKTANAKKGNFYPINKEIREKMLSFWTMLKQRKAISDEKYKRLVRSYPLSDEELAAFVSRQLVTTRQATKAVTALIEKYYPESRIYYVKAKLASDFRKDFDMLKCREVNDLHHAKDAYLNIVVGNVYYTLSARRDYISGLQSGTYSMNGVFKYPVKGAWETDGEKSIATVRKMMAKNNIRFVRYASKQTGGFYKQMPCKKASGNLVPLKGSGPLADTEKYGGYQMPVSCYFALVRFTDEKGKLQRRFVAIDLYRESEYLRDPVGFMNRELGAANAHIEIPCIKYNTLFSVDGFRVHLSSKSGGGQQLVFKPAVQLVLPYRKEIYVKNIIKYINESETLHKELDVDYVTQEENIEIYDAISSKLEETVFSNCIQFKKLAEKLLAKRDKFKSLTVYEQCKVLMEILKITKCNIVFGDLRLLDESKSSGIVTLSANVLGLGKNKSFKIIHQSVTGLFEQQIELLN